MAKGAGVGVASYRAGAYGAVSVGKVIRADVQRKLAAVSPSGAGVIVVSLALALQTGRPPDGRFGRFVNLGAVALVSSAGRCGPYSPPAGLASPPSCV